MTQNHSDDVLLALRDELATVTPSSEFADRVRQRIAGDLPLLREELAAVTPSPEFKARVRQRIDANGGVRRTPSLFGWRALLPASLAAAALLAVVLAPRGPEKPAPVIALTDLKPPPMIDQYPPAGFRGVPSQNQAPADVRARSRAAVRAANAGGGRAPAEPKAEGLSLEVITNQPAILRAMAERILQDALVIENTIPLAENAAEIKVLPIEVSPVVVKPLAETPEGGSSPIIRKN